MEYSQSFFENASHLLFFLVDYSSIGRGKDIAVLGEGEIELIQFDRDGIPLY